MGFSLRYLFLLLLLPTALGDGVNWIDPHYAVTYPYHPRPDLATSARAIISRGRASAKAGPFTITKGDITAPSGTKHDYLSWAPYHWPNCGWCKTRDSTNQRAEDLGDETIEASPDQSSEIDSTTPTTKENTPNEFFIPSSTLATTAVPSLPHVSPPEPLNVEDSELNADGRRPSRTQSASCAPSPTTSMAPSSTWTTCPYVARDGKVNPDRNQLHGLSQLNSFAQATIDNTLAFLLDHDQNLASKAAQFIDVFFLQSSTAMNPRLDWGQTVRGPSQHGSYMGILDFRVLIKVVNAIQILRLSRSPYWSKDRDARMITWAQSYLDWLDSSELGKRPKRSANNHSTFYYGQVAALRILTLDEIGALNAVQTYFGGPFQEQIVSSGEQPFESTRVKPFHYRVFNLEAMVTVAKLGSYLGVDRWRTQTRYKATIKTAIDYLVTLDPGQEEKAAAMPLVACALSVYGDDNKSTYRKYLESFGTRSSEDGKSRTFTYKTKSWWFYEQPDAMKGPQHRRREEQYDALYQITGQDVMSPFVSTRGKSSMPGDETLQLASSDQSDQTEPTAPSHNADSPREGADVIAFHPDRPAPFISTDTVELEEGIYVYWNQISYLYEGSHARRSRWARW